MKLASEKFIQSIQSNWIKYEYRIILVIGFLLVAGISFEFGYMQSKSFKSTPLVIEKPAESSKNDAGSPLASSQVSDTTNGQKASVAADLTAPKNLPVGQANCVFVGSKNSNKYYPPTCSYAKRIKPENVVCFANAQEALAQGRTASTGCK